MENNTNKLAHHDLVVRTLKALGYPRTDGRNDRYSGSVESLMPWLIMDAMREVMHERIGKYPCRQELKRIRDRWLETYQRFNHSFWQRVPEADHDAIVDIMDAMLAAVGEDMERLRAVLAKQVPTDREDIKAMIADGYCCQVICQIAAQMYERVYRVQRVRGTKKRVLVWETAKCEPIERCSHSAMCFYSYLSRANGIAAIPLTDEVYDANGALCRAFVRFIRQTDKQNETNNNEQ